MSPRCLALFFTVLATSAVPDLAMAQSDAEAVAAGGDSASGGASADGDDGAEAADGVPTRGQWSVSPSGSFSYQVPIEVPAGRNGLAPGLSLRYSSSAGNGPLGVGWALGGLPAIVRLPFEDGVHYDGNDVYALSEGGLASAPDASARLVKVADGTYHTYDERWVSLAPQGACGDGPCTWTMRDGSGNTYHFGGMRTHLLWEPDNGRVGARGVQAWALRYIEDEQGNRLYVHYTRIDDMLYPERVRYGCVGVGGCSNGVREVRFGWERRVDPMAAPYSITRRLRDITVRSASSQVRRYSLRYELSASSLLSMLSFIHEYGSDNRTEAPRSRFDYTERGDLQPGSTWRSDDLADHSVRTLSGDFDGNGFADLARVALEVGHARVSIARGHRGGLGAATTREIGGNHHRWQAAVVDMNADGRDDLVLLTGEPRVEIKVAYGSAGQGLQWPPVPYEYNRALDEIREGYSPPAHRFRVLRADVNGDQLDDLVVVNRQLGNVAVVRATEGGPAEPVLQFAPAPPDAAFRAEPAIVDTDGDGCADIVLAYSAVSTAGGGLSALVFPGDRDAVLGGADAIDWEGAVPTGVSPYQIVAGDRNGDAKGDLLLSYTGPRIGGDAGDTRPFRRDLRAFDGRTDGAADYAELATDVSVSLPVLRERGAAFWNHHGGDVNGDGLLDVVAQYTGRNGRAIYAAISDRGGETSVTEQGHLRSTAVFPDGDANVHKWASQVADINGDGRDDLVLYYAGRDGMFVDVVWGTLSGLGSAFDRVIDEPGRRIAEVSDDDDGRAAGSVTLVVDDFDGDGRPDVLLAAREGYVYRLSEPEMGDLLDRIENGIGGTTEVAYAATTRVSGAFRGDVVCAIDACGRPVRDGPLATRVTVQSGRGIASDTTYGFQDVRYRPGVPAERAFLGPWRFVERNQLTGARSETEFHRRAPFEGRPRRTAMFDRNGVRLRDIEHDYDEATTSIYDTRWVRRASTVEKNFEGGRLGFVNRTEIGYDPFGQVIRTTRCQGGECFENRTIHGRDLGAWIVSRPIATRRGRPDSKLLLEATETDYDDAGLVVETRRFLCDDAEKCECFDGPHVCEAEGTGRWVVEAQDFEYDEAGNVLAVTDSMGRRTSFEYDGRFGTHRTKTIRRVQRDGAWIALEQTTVYDDRGLVRFEIDENRRMSALEHDVLGRKTRVQHADGGWERWRYDHFGNPNEQSVRHDVFVGTQVIARPCPAAIIPSEKVAVPGVPLGLLFPQMPIPGLPLPKDPAPKFPIPGVPKPSFPEPRPESPAPGFPKPGFPKPEIPEPEIPWPGGGGGCSGETVSIDDTQWDVRFFDGAGRIYERASEHPEGRVVVKQEEQWREGRRVVRVSSPFIGGREASAQWVETVYDDRGRELETVLLDGSLRELGPLSAVRYEPFRVARSDNAATLAANGRLGTPNWRRTAEEYAPNGLLLRRIDASGAVVTYSYDSAHRQDGILGPIDEEAELDATVQVIQRYFDSWGRRRRIEDTARGDRDYVYDDGNRLIEETDARDRRYIFEYDELDRITSRFVSIDGTWPPKTLGVYRYDAADVPNGIGRLSRVNDEDVNTTIDAYDAAGRELSRTVRIKGLRGAYTETMTYDPAGRLASIEMPDGTSVKYSYAEDGTLHEVDSDEASAVFLDPDANGSPRRRILGNLMTTRFDYRPGGELRSLVTERGGQLIQKLGFDHDAVGNIRGLSDRAGKWSFGIDAVDRLVGASRAESGRVVERRDYDYDPAGNITVLGDIDSISYEPRRVRGYRGPALAYEARFDTVGHLMSKKTADANWSYTYGDDDRLQSVVRDSHTLTARFGYDADGRRTTKTEYWPGGYTRTYYVTPRYELRQSSRAPGVLAATVHVTTPEGGVIATVTREQLPGAPGAPVGGSGAAEGGTLFGLPVGVYYKLTDHLGSVQVVADDRGSVVSRYRYAPYGGRTDVEGVGISPETYTGKTFDSSTDLYYYEARYYDPMMARFITPDTVLPGGGDDPRGLNRYAYAYMNPVRYNDQDGHCPPCRLRMPELGESRFGLSAEGLRQEAEIEALTRNPGAAASTSQANTALLRETVMVGAMAGATPARAQEPIRLPTESDWPATLDELLSRPDTISAVSEREYAFQQAYRVPPAPHPSLGPGAREAWRADARRIGFRASLRLDGFDYLVSNPVGNVAYSVFRAGGRGHDDAMDLARAFGIAWDFVAFTERPELGISDSRRGESGMTQRP